MLNNIIIFLVNPLVPDNALDTALRCFSIRPGPDTIEATLLRPLDNNALASVLENLSETPLRPT